MAPVVAVVGAVAATVGTVASYASSRKAQKKQEQAAQQQQAQQTLAVRRQRRQAIRAAQVTRAQAVASAGASGALGSSAASGGIGSISSQLGNQMGFSTAMSGLSQNINTLNQQAANYGANAQTWGSVANLGMTAFNASGGFNNFQRQLTSAPQPTWGNAPFSQVGVATQ